MAEQRLSKKILNVCIVGIIIVIIIFVAMMLILNYDLKGETNMPFEISKITLISTVDGKNVENSENKWDINVIQNNDIYIYLEKNKEYRKSETISSVKLDNFNIKKQNEELGLINLYRPTDNDKSLFQNIEENIIKELEYKGMQSTNTKKLEISNQGGVISFRCANNNIGIYTSNNDDEINYGSLISKLNINEEDLRAKLTFNITIKLDSGKVFKAEGVSLEIPNENISIEGTVGKEYTNLENIVFKRIEN